MQLSKYTKLAIEAALKAGEEIIEIYNSGDFNVELKGDQSPLTRADVASHQIIMSYLEDTGIPVLSEEGREISFEERGEWNQLWIVDPIDGTKEFIKRNGEFTVNIALIEKQKPILGVVYAPATGDLYFSEENIGAFKSIINPNELLNLDLLLNASSKLPLEKTKSIYTIVASRSHRSEETNAYIKEKEKEHGKVEIVSVGSSLKLCLVAEGSAHCYPRFAPTMEWDTAAGQAICNHSGVDVIDYQTQKTMLYNRVQLLNNWFLVES
jgi:3'(2'), 5'-bisphosphate nucleotidase